MVDPVHAPEERHVMEGRMLGVNQQIEREKRERQGEDKRRVELVEEPDLPRLAP